MPDRLRISTAGVRLHQFVAGGLPVVAYLLGWIPPVWIALGLSMLALLSDRLAIAAWFLRRRPHSYAHEDPGPLLGLFKVNEGTRVVLLGVGLALLAAGYPEGWLPVLAAASTSILEGTTAFSFNLLTYTVLRVVMRRLGLGGAEAGGEETRKGNPNCVVCHTLAIAPYGRCHWCRLTSIRWCCGLQTSLMMVLLLVIAFLLNAAIQPAITKFLVTLSILSVVVLSLIIARQTNDIIGTLNTLERAHQKIERRFHFLKRLALVDTVQASAEAVVAFTAETFGAGRVSVMGVDEGVLRIVASRGIPADVAGRVAVPVPDRICGRVFASGTPVVLNDAEDEGGLVEMLGLHVDGALASFPLVVATMQTAARNVGVINVTDRPSGPFTAEDLAELQFVAEAAAISLSSQMDRRDLERGNYATIRSLVLAIEAKDACTHGHSLRVQVWGTAVARRLGLTGTALQMLTYAAELHDIGKLAIPDEILKAPRPLTKSEWAIVQEHPRRGVELVRHLAFLKPTLGAIHHHHERLDGTGYPDGLAGDAIPLEARILAVVDAYDAMTSERPYRPPLSHEEAAAEIRRMTGRQFDPACAEAFLSLLGGAVTHADALAATPA
ncbi:MAG: HD domain-containing protein [Planctomycetes bacterium]|nr:HD domain-containing protein [Planctomycetota bacterium]